MKKIVPKCEDCSYHDYENEEEYKRGLRAVGGGQRHHWCSHPQSPRPLMAQRVFISANEAKINPKWCPLRDKIEQ